MGSVYVCMGYVSMCVHMYVLHCMYVCIAMYSMFIYVCIVLYVLYISYMYDYFNMRCLSSTICATRVIPHLTYISITLLAIQHLFLVHLFLGLYSSQQTHAKPTCYHNETRKVQIMFQTNNNSLDERKVMETVLYYNTYNYLFINLLPLQQLEIRTLHSRNDVAPRKMNTMSADNKNTRTQSVKSKVGVTR